MHYASEATHGSETRALDPKQYYARTVKGRWKSPASGEPQRHSTLNSLYPSLLQRLPLEVDVLITDIHWCSPAASDVRPSPMTYTELQLWSRPRRSLFPSCITDSRSQ